MTLPRLAVVLALLLAGCDEIPRIEQQRRELEKKSTAVHAEIEALNAQIQRLQEASEETFAGTTVASVSKAFELVLTDTEAKVAELSQRLKATEEKLATVRRDIEEYQKKYQRP